MNVTASQWQYITTVRTGQGEVRRRIAAVASGNGRGLQEPPISRAQHLINDSKKTELHELVDNVEHRLEIDPFR
jgi:hypothetical protein